MIWMSPSYRKKHADLIFDDKRPYSTEDFIYSLSDLAGLDYKDYNDSRSLFSKEFKAKERYVGEKRYEEIMAKFKEYKE